MPVSSPLSAMMLTAAGSNLVIAEWEQEPGPLEGRMAVVPLHMHHACDEAWYVLEGRLGVQLGHEEVEIGPGEAALAPRGMTHTFWNPDPVQPVRYLLIMTAKTAALIDEIHSASDRSWPAMKALFARYDAELIG